MPKHFWECDCGYTVDFRQPELPQDSYHSEMNGDKKCPHCKDDMYFDEYPEVVRLTTPTDIDEIDDDPEGEEDVED